MTVPPPNYSPPGPPSGTPPGPWQGPPSPPSRPPGRLLGALLAVAFLCLLFVVAANSGLPIGSILAALPVAIVVATVAVARERYRQYAVGFLLGLASVLIVGGGACIGLFAMMGQVG